jgi:hypothetical protein
MDNNIRWADAIGKKLIKKIQIEIHAPDTKKKCIKCDKFFVYKHDDTEKLEGYYVGINPEI